MPARPAEALSADDLLDEVVAEYLEAERGGQPDRQEWLARYPELATGLSEFFADHDRVRNLLMPFESVAGTTAPGIAASGDTLSLVPPPFGDYELLACIGHGGMGVVYRARQRSLDRLVAVKMLRMDQLTSPTELQRFQNEAELVAQLDHPGIVPVYEVGTHDGRPFFTMKLIEGGSLVSHPDRFADPRGAAALVMRVAQAVHHAHQRGVLHRDLKPSNILLDAEGEPHVTDFGLARRLETDSGLTVSHAIVGTPSYMAPEQTFGANRGVTTATDVYGLGAILYALLAGRPPFAGESVLDTLEQVRRQEPLAPRRLRPGVPRDLETICLKCLAKVPAQRYGSAAELADELGRFLDGKPVLARPTGVCHRLAKWARRRPAAASLVGVTVAAAVVVAVLVVRHERQLRDALEESRRHEKEAQQRKAEAMANYRQARETIGRMLTRLRNPKAGELPRLAVLRREQQEDALAFVLSVAEQVGDEPEVLSDVAAARMLAAQLQVALGRIEPANANAIAARDLLAGLVERFPDDTGYRGRLAYTWVVLGTTHQRGAEAAASLQTALAMYEALEGRGVDCSAGRSMVFHNLGDVSHHAGDRVRAEGYWREALAIQVDRHGRQPLDPDPLRGVVKNQINLSLLLQADPARLPESERLRDEAEANLERVIAADGSDFDCIHDLALLRVNWAYVRLARFEFEKALADLGKNVALLEPALAREPDLELLRVAMFRTRGTRATTLERMGRLKDAVADYEHVVALSPGAERLTHRLALALLRGRAGDHLGAVEGLEALTDELPASTDWGRYYRMARVCSQAVANLEKDEAIPADARPSRAARYTQAALRLLEKARAVAPPAEWQKQAAKLNDDFRPLVREEAFRHWQNAKLSAKDR